MMNYYVFVSPPNKWATVHKGDCSHCNEGAGQKKLNKSPLTTEWLGPYVTREEALLRAEKTGMKMVTTCGHCRP